MQRPRAMAASVIVPQQSQQRPGPPTQYLFFMIGGVDSTATYLQDYEYSIITVYPPVFPGFDYETQIIQPWVLMNQPSNLLPEPRAGLSAVLVDGYYYPQMDSSEYIYLLGGKNYNGSVETVLASVLSDTGSLNWMNLDTNLTTPLEGSCVGKTPNSLFYMGGQGGLPNNSGAAAFYCDATQVPDCNSVPPDILSWNGTVSPWNNPRFYGACVQDGISTFVVGGANAAGALTSVESTLCCS